MNTEQDSFAAQELATKLLKDRVSNDPVWSAAEQRLLASLLLHVQVTGGTFDDLKALLQIPLPELEKLLLHSQSTSAQAEYLLLQQNSSPQFLMGVHAGILKALDTKTDWT